MTVPWLFQDLRKGLKTGMAVFEQDATTKKVYFKQGDVLFASSNRVEDRLGEFLLRTGKISRDQFDKASEVVIKTRRQLGAVLFNMGFLTAHDLVAQVKLQVKEIILSLFSWRQGQCRFDAGPISGAEIIPLRMSTGNLILEGLKHIDREVIRELLQPLETVIHPAADPLLLFQDADLQPDQRKVLSLIDGNKSMEEICSLSGIDEVDTFKAIYILLALRLAEKGKIKPEGEKKLVREAGREAIVDDVKTLTITRKELQAAYDSLERQSHYEVLNVGPGATAHEIRQAYLSLAKHYHPDRHFSAEMHDRKEQLEVLFHAIHEAYETLTNQGKRDQYNLGPARGEKKHRTAGQANADQPDNRNRALAQFEEGMKKFNSGNFWGAEEAFEWAMRLDPGNADYVFHRGLALSRIPQKGHDAEEYFIRAIELAPTKTGYTLELGQFYVRHGLKTKALSVYRDALKREPHSAEIMQAFKKAGA
jgi:tetratricopeptide (TPR) repeat protein